MPSPGANLSEEPDQEPLRHAALSELRHNLRTPINHVLGYTEMLIEDASDAHRASALEWLRLIHSTARGALADVNTALSNRDSVDRHDIDGLCQKIRPRTDRIQSLVEQLRSHAPAVPPEWAEDLDRVSYAAGTMADCFSAVPRTAPTPHAVPELRPAKGPRLLVVDDNATNRHVLSRRLERQGYLTEEAANGNEAIDRLAEGEFDLVLLDILMPGMDGFEVLQRMRGDSRLRTIPVVVVSALDEVESVVRAIEIGADDYLFKPFDPVLLRARIGALIERKRLASELTVQAKLASLGALTAGIAHEIKNPLNFVINFAELSADLVREQIELIDTPAPDAGRWRELRGIAVDLADNLAKIREHGGRADSIIGSMLAHSRGQPGERRSTDLNALVRDYVNLAFHGMRAQDNTFQAAIEGEYDPAVGMVDVVPQDLSRALLNIASNACFAVREKSRRGIPGYQPVLSVRTRDCGGGVEIRIRDNGTGIPKDFRERVFDPFFTTKPAGEGAGLGLSISYEIVVHEHGGEMRVASGEDAYTEFTMVIPRTVERQ